MIILQVIGWLLIFSGLFVVLTGSLGLLKFPNFYVRLHPTGLVDALGLPMVIIGFMFLDGFTAISLKLLILIAITLLTSPTACHALAKAAYYSGKPPESKE